MDAVQTAMHESVRVMIVEDQREIREGLRFLIENTPNYCCTGVFGSMEEALPAISAAVADVVLVDLGLPGMSGVDRIGEKRTASVTFDIFPPMWQRWWFIAIATILMGMAFFAFHRARLRRLIDMERVRGRIATDLHDDIGSGLSQIAILSEVAIKEVGANGTAREPLARIAATSRELVDTMSDIVWAINPRHEQLGDLTQRMRRFASDMLGSRDIDFRLCVPTAADQTKLGPHVRREVYLIFKESVTNAVRHSGCTEAEIELRLERQRLILQVRDNGHRVPSTHEGNGVASMHARAAPLGGSLAVSSQNGRGTTLTMTLPLGPHGR